MLIRRYNGEWDGMTRNTNYYTGSTIKFEFKLKLLCL